MQEDKDSNKMKFNINLLNCFGIRKLDNSFDLSRGNFVLIYAHNGTMKTSLAKLFCAQKRITMQQMFEPIIDMSSEHLKRLYKEVKSLNGTE